MSEQTSSLNVFCALHDRLQSIISNSLMLDEGGNNRSFKTLSDASLVFCFKHCENKIQIPVKIHTHFTSIAMKIHSVPVGTLPAMI